MTKDTFYFSHDYNARFDEKIKQLIRKHSMLGYGCYWAIIEDLYNNANALRTDYDGIAFELRITTEQAKSIINDFDLFVFDGDYFGSASVERRLNERNEKSVKARQSAFNRWNKVKDDANALRTQSDGNAIKESKGKENKKKDSKFTPPTLIEVQDYFKEKGYTIESATKAFNYYDIANWVDSNGNKVKSWKQKMQGVWFKDENKIKITTQNYPRI
jgi:hypothetical protein